MNITNNITSLSIIATALILGCIGSISGLSSVAYGQIPLMPNMTPPPIRPPVSTSSSVPIPTITSSSFSNATGTVASLQNNETGKPTWILSGKWIMVLPKVPSTLPQDNQLKTAAAEVAVFNSSFTMVKTNGAEMHKHKILDFKLKGMPMNNSKEMSTTFKGTATITMKDGPHRDVPISIVFMGKSAISIIIDPTTTNNHFGNTPIYGTVTKIG